MRIKQFATVGVIIVSLLSVVFFLTYKDYKYTFKREENINLSADIARSELSQSVYKALQREAKGKTDRLAKEIREGLVYRYGDDLSQFEKEYEYPVEDSVLITTIDETINSEQNRFFHVENDSNDMFVASRLGIVSDKSQDCAAYGITRTYEQEISMHFNKQLASQAIEGMLNGKENLFWRFKGPAGSKEIGLREMDIDKVLALPIEELKDYEFLSVSYIDRYGDLLGTEDVTATGQKQDSKKLIVVQGFNLYDHIQSEFKENYLEIEKGRAGQLSAIVENRKSLSRELVLILAIVFISFFSIAILQNEYVSKAG